MSERSSIGATWSFAMALAVVGGSLAVTGTALPWASAEGIRASEFFGGEIVGIGAAAGASHVSGLVAATAGAVVVIMGLAALLVRESGTRWAAAGLAVLGGLVVLGACAYGLYSSKDAAGDLPEALRQPDVVVKTEPDVGVVVAAAGGVVAAAGGLVARRVAP